MRGRGGEGSGGVFMHSSRALRVYVRCKHLTVDTVLHYIQRDRQTDRQTHRDTQRDIERERFPENRQFEHNEVLLLFSPTLHKNEFTCL